MRSAFHRGTAACLLAACLALAGCGSPRPLASGPGVTAISVTLGTDQPLTGPASPGYSEIAAASTAFFNYVNDHGGVYGRSIHLTVHQRRLQPHPDGRRDQPAGALRQRLRHLRGGGDGRAAADTEGVLPFLEGSQVPDLFPASGCPCLADGTDNPYTFGWQPSATIEGKILGSYIKTHFPRARVGVLFQDDASGHAALAGLRDEVRGSWPAKPTPRRNHPQRTDRGDQGREGLGARRLHPPRIHGHRAVDRIQAELSPAPRRVERGQ